jgi:hypothetical protein
MTPGFDSKWKIRRAGIFFSIFSHVHHIIDQLLLLLLLLLQWC